MARRVSIRLTDNDLPLEYDELYVVSVPEEAFGDTFAAIDHAADLLKQAVVRKGVAGLAFEAINLAHRAGRGE